MAVKLQPAAHPIGTSVEVLDLFFNTPARRKFLRTEKTEFTHIDELLKRIALSRFDVTINLRHNGKMVRQYRAAKTEIQAEKRIAAVCGNAFVRHMLKIELEHQGLRLHGWITTPEGARQQSDLQYCYVNGRMMRDKLINHAIRQSYETSLRPDQFATYVLFIELDPHQVDVNVHPAKHEVRFHQARLVHDFIYQALSDGLAQTKHIDAAPVNQSAFHQAEPELSDEVIDSTEGVDTFISTQPSSSIDISQAPERAREAIDKTPAYPRKAESERVRESVQDRTSNYSLSQDQSQHGSGRQSFTGSPRQEWIESRPAPKPDKPSNQHHAEPAPSKREVKAYKELLQTPEFPNSTAGDSALSKDSSSKAAPVAEHSPLERPIIAELGKAITVVNQQYLAMGSKNGCLLLSLAKAEFLRVVGQMNTQHGPLKSQPLLVPLSMKVGGELVEVAKALSPQLNLLGIELKARNSEAIMVMGVPSPLRQQNLQILIPDLLSYAASLNIQSNNAQIMQQLVNWIGVQTAQVKSDYTLSEAVQLVGELEQLWQGLLPLDDPEFVNPVDFSATIAAFTI